MKVLFPLSSLFTWPGLRSFYLNFTLLLSRHTLTYGPCPGGHNRHSDTTWERPLGPEAQVLGDRVFHRRGQSP